MASCATEGMVVPSRSLSQRSGGAPFHRLASVLALWLLAACADGFVQFPTDREAQSALAETVDVIVLDATNIGNFTSRARAHHATQMPFGGGWTYNVGVGDILSVIVFNHPELTLPAGPQRSAAETGFQVGADGTINYPFIGSVRASGRPVDQIRNDIAGRLSTFIPDPQIEVRVAAFNSQAIIVSGEVRTPNRQALTTVPLSLLAAINAAGGFTDAAEPREVIVQRGGRSYTVDVQGFLSGGLRQNDPFLRDGDVVNVGRRRAEEAFLLGEVARPDAIDLSRESITLTQAISRRGGLQQQRADARGVLVFRAAGERMRVFQLDTQNPTGLLLGTRFVLEPGDVVYVLRSPLQRWNDTITRLLPTVTAIRSIDALAN